VSSGTLNQGCYGFKTETENRGFKVKSNRNRTTVLFSGGHVTVFLEFQKRPSPVTNVPKQQPNYRLSRLRNDLYCVEWDVKLYYTIPCNV